jgi:hypothetical protein
MDEIINLSEGKLVHETITYGVLDPSAFNRTAAPR